MFRGVAYITSAAKGLGHATVKSLLQDGWDVFFTYGNSEQEAQELEGFARMQGREAVSMPVDMMDKSAVLTSVRRCLEQFGRVDAFIHNFGPFVFERHTLADYTDEMWHEMLDGNLTNFVWIYREVIDGMRKRAFGRIISIGYDGAGDAVGWRYRAAYAAAKAGLAALTRSIAKEERQNGITANMVCPGDIRGAHKMEMIDEVAEVDNPLGRPPVGDDVGRVITFLCAPASQQLSGTVTAVTGGYDILSFDDEKYAVREPREFTVGESVWVHPWLTKGTIQDAVKASNRYRVYTVHGEGGRQGEFTAFQLSSEVED